MRTDSTQTTSASTGRQIRLLTSILSPTFQAGPMVFLTTALTRQHLLRPLTPFILNTIAHPTKDLHIGLSQFFSSNTPRRILLTQPQVSNKDTAPPKPTNYTSSSCINQISTVQYRHSFTP